MGHYPIKCIRCTKIIKNDEVLFDTKNVVTSMVDLLRGTQGVQRARNDSNQPSQKNRWDSEDDSDTPKNRQITLSDKMTLPELRDFVATQKKRGVCQPKYLPVEVSPDFADAEGTENEGLLTEIAFSPQEGGAVVRASTRYCPHCFNELPKQAGFMPTYIVTLIGTSSSGKTVYLCALNMILSSTEGGLPYRSTLSSVSGNSASHIIKIASNDLFYKGKLPPTTQNLLSEPLVFVLTYRFQKYKKQCILALTDMRGEDMIQLDGANLRQRGEYFSGADGFLFVVSPLNMDKILAKLPPEIGKEERKTPHIHEEMRRVVSGALLTHFPYAVIDAPSVVMLSKCDILKLYFREIRLPQYNAVVAKEPTYRYTGGYFETQKDGVSNILKQYDWQLFDFLRNSFSAAEYTSSSSIGPFATIEDTNQDRVVKNPNRIQPIRIQDPIILLLMRLGFLPKFSGMEVDTIEANDHLMKKWVEECSTRL